MTDPRDDTSWDALADFADRSFEGVSGHATATVDGTLSLTDVRVDGPFHENTSACIRKAINYALITAREQLARYLASKDGPDLPPAVQAVLDGATAPESHRPQLLHDYEARRAGVLVKIDGRKCLVTWVDVPSAKYLSLLPDVVNAAITAAETGKDAPPLAELFERDWADIVADLSDMEGTFSAIVSEHEDQDHGHGAPRSGPA